MSRPADAVKTNARPLVLALGFVLLAFVVAAPSLRGPFISDDVLYLESNPVLALPFAQALPKVLDRAVLRQLDAAPSSVPARRVARLRHEPAALSRRERAAARARGARDGGGRSTHRAVTPGGDRRRDAVPDPSGGGRSRSGGSTSRRRCSRSASRSPRSNAGSRGSAIRVRVASRRRPRSARSRCSPSPPRSRCPRCSCSRRGRTARAAVCGAQRSI